MRSGAAAGAVCALKRSVVEEKACGQKRAGVQRWVNVGRRVQKGSQMQAQARRFAPVVREARNAPLENPPHHSPCEVAWVGLASGHRPQALVCLHGCHPLPWLRLWCPPCPAPLHRDGGKGKLDEQKAGLLC